MSAMSAVVEQQGKKRKRPAHHANNSGTAFQNPWPSASLPTWGELLKVSFPLNWYNSDPLPDYLKPVEVVEPDWGVPLLKARESQSDCIVATWLGHAGTMAEFPPLSTQDQDKDSTYFVFDPIFSLRAGPSQMTGPARLRKSPCQASDLPGCHAVFISHNHYDHLDLNTVLNIHKRFPGTKWFIPLGNKSWFLTSGIKPDNVVELDWWQTWEGTFPQTTAGAKQAHALFKMTCLPAQHNTGRVGIDGGNSLWCGWAVERFSSNQSDTLSKTRTGSVYHAGDTGYRRIQHSKEICPVFKEIGDKFSGFDVSFLPIWRGGSLGWISYAGIRLRHENFPSSFHCSPEDAINIHLDVKSKNTIAIHFGTWVGSEKESNEAVMEFHDACTKAEVLDLRSTESSAKGRAGTLDIGGSILFTTE
jgi:N-acyl-phosphatidylethanolamine-hydrolysing phospholipase D